MWLICEELARHESVFLKQSPEKKSVAYKSPRICLGETITKTPTRGCDKRLERIITQYSRHTSFFAKYGMIVDFMTFL